MHDVDPGAPIDHDAVAAHGRANCRTTVSFANPWDAANLLDGYSGPSTESIAPLSAPPTIASNHGLLSPARPAKHVERRRSSAVSTDSAASATVSTGLDALQSDGQERSRSGDSQVSLNSSAAHAQAIPSKTAYHQRTSSLNTASQPLSGATATKLSSLTATSRPTVTSSTARSPDPSQKSPHPQSQSLSHFEKYTTAPLKSQAAAQIIPAPLKISVTASQSAAAATSANVARPASARSFPFALPSPGLHSPSPTGDGNRAASPSRPPSSREYTGDYSPDAVNRASNTSSGHSVYSSTSALSSRALLSRHSPVAGFTGGISHVHGIGPLKIESTTGSKATKIKSTKHRSASAHSRASGGPHSPSLGISSADIFGESSDASISSRGSSKRSVSSRPSLFRRKQSGAGTAGITSPGTTRFPLPADLGDSTSDRGEISDAAFSTSAYANLSADSDQDAARPGDLTLNATQLSGARSPTSPGKASSMANLLDGLRRGNSNASASSQNESDSHNSQSSSRASLYSGTAGGTHKKKKSFFSRKYDNSYNDAEHLRQLAELRLKALALVAEPDEPLQQPQRPPNISGRSYNANIATPGVLQSQIPVGGAESPRRRRSIHPDAEPKSAAVRSRKSSNAAKIGGIATSSGKSDKTGSESSAYEDSDSDGARAANRKTLPLFIARTSNFPQLESQSGHDGSDADDDETHDDNLIGIDGRRRSTLKASVLTSPRKSSASLHIRKKSSTERRASIPALPDVVPEFDALSMTDERVRDQLSQLEERSSHAADRSRAARLTVSIDRFPSGSMALPSSGLSRSSSELLDLDDPDIDSAARDRRRSTLKPPDNPASTSSAMLKSDSARSGHSLPVSPTSHVKRPFAHAGSSSMSDTDSQPGSPKRVAVPVTVSNMSAITANDSSILHRNPPAEETLPDPDTKIAESTHRHLPRLAADDAANTQEAVTETADDLIRHLDRAISSQGESLRRSTSVRISGAEPDAEPQSRDSSLVYIQPLRHSSTVHTLQSDNVARSVSRDQPSEEPLADIPARSAPVPLKLETPAYGRPMPAAFTYRNEIRKCRSSAERAMVYATKLAELSAYDTGLLAVVSALQRSQHSEGFRSTPGLPLTPI